RPTTMAPAFTRAGERIRSVPWIRRESFGFSTWVLIVPSAVHAGSSVGAKLIPVSPAPANGTPGPVCGGSGTRTIVPATALRRFVSELGGVLNTSPYASPSESAWIWIDVPAGAKREPLKLPSAAAVAAATWPVSSVTRNTTLLPGTAPPLPLTMTSPLASGDVTWIRLERGGTSGYSGVGA